MPCVKILQRRKIRDDHALKAPVFPKDLLQQQFRSAAGFPQGAVVSAHDLGDFPLFHRCLKCGKIGLPQVLGADFRIELMADGLRAGMDGIVLGAGCRHKIIGIVPLQAPDIADAHAARKPGIFPIGLLTAAPAGITEDIDVGAVQAQALEQIAHAMGGILLVFDPCLLAYGPADLAHQRRVKGGAQADALGKHGRSAFAGNTMKRFAPPVHFRDPQPFQGRRGGNDLGDLFLRSHAGDQVFRTADKAQACVQVVFHFVSPSPYSCADTANGPAFRQARWNLHQKSL